MDYGDGELSLTEMLRRGDVRPSGPMPKAVAPGVMGRALRDAEVILDEQGQPQIVIRRDRPRVPGPIDESGREVIFPEGREGGRQYLELPGMRLPLGKIAEHPLDELWGMARTAPMMMGYTAGPAGAFTFPAKLYGAPAISVAERAAKSVAAHPRVAAISGALPGTLLASSAADTGQGAGPRPVDYEPPGLLGEIKTLLGGKAEDQRPLTADEYKDKNRKLAPRSKPDFISDELAAVRASEAYQTAGPSKRNSLMNQAQANAEKLYTGYQQSVKDEEGRLTSAYADYRKGWDTQRAEHLAKPFVERNPIAGTTLTYGGPVLATLLARGGFGKINKMGADIASRGVTARAGDDMRGLADAITSAERYRWAAPAGKAAIATEAAALPVEMRAAMDFGDANALPPDAPARIKAQERLNDWQSYLTKSEQNLVSGAIGTLGGMGWAKVRTPSPGIDLATLRSHARGLPKGAPDEMAIGLAERAAAAKDAEARLLGTAPKAPAAALDIAPAEPARAPLQIAAPAAEVGATRPALPAPDQPRLAQKVLAKDQQLQREALPNPDAAALTPPKLPKSFVEQGGSWAGPTNPNQTRIKGQWGPTLDSIKKQSKAKSDAPQSKPSNKAVKPEQSVNPEGPIVKEPMPIQDDLAPYGRPSRGPGRQSALSDFLRSMA